MNKAHEGESLHKTTIMLLPSQRIALKSKAIAERSSMQEVIGLLIKSYVDGKITLSDLKKGK